MTHVSLVEGSDRRILLVCEHASNHVPPGIHLGISDSALRDHIGWDIGAAAVTVAVARLLGSPAVLATASRLVVDCNRPPDLAIPEVSDGVVIPGNCALTASQRVARLELHRAFHDGLAAQILAAPPRLIVSIHSFTPALASNPQPRPWPIAILWNSDERTARLGLAALATEAGLGGPVGMNEPYSGKDLNYSMDRHAEAAGIPSLGFEIRQDGIGEPEGVKRWAAIVARTVAATAEAL